MSSADVQQLQALNKTMEAQWQAYPSAERAAVLGVAGGNGLEYCGRQIKKVYGVDINKTYLDACRQRFGETLKDRLELVQMDLPAPETQLPKVDLLLADLVIEYVGIETFCKKAAGSFAKWVSRVIQAPASGGFVSASPYQSQLSGISTLHCDIDLDALRRGFLGYGYEETYSEAICLPNGKALLAGRFPGPDSGKMRGKKKINNYTKLIFCIIQGRANAHLTGIPRQIRQKPAFAIWRLIY